jgi:hypothetical protein
LTIKSIVERCKDSFNVFLVDDDCFRKLVPGWKIDMDLVPSPLRERYRQFGLTSLLYHYGGLLVPPSTLCLEDLHPLYTLATATKDAFAVQTSVEFPDPRFCGAKKKSDLIRKFRDHQAFLLQTDQSGASDFSKQSSQWCQTHMQVVCGGRVGAKKTCGSNVDLADLTSKNPIPFHDNLVAISSDSSIFVLQHNKTAVAKYLEDGANEAQTKPKTLNPDP